MPEHDVRPRAATDVAELIKDERIKETASWRKALIRPELGAICGTILVFVFFAVIAGGTGMFAPQGILNWGVVSAQFAVIAVGACLLMIAGEFDLSVGSMIGFSGIVIALMSVTWGYPVWVAILVAFAVAIAIGALNGYLVIKTGLPSFIVTLAFLYILRGLTIYISISTTRQTIIGGVKEVAAGDPLAWLFGGKIFGGLFVWLADVGVVSKFVAGPRAGEPVIDGIPMLLVWAFALIASPLLLGWRPLLTGVAIFSAVAVLNQLRTLVAHLWENEGEAMTVTGQFLDSVNVPPPAPLAALWAPVGLRYHALHHLMPSMPYHALGAAHRRLAAQLGADSTYQRANHAGMMPLVARIARSTMRAR